MKLKKNLLLAGMLALTFGLVASPVLANDADYTITNHTGMTIASIYVSPSNENEWGPDIMAEDTLADGEECGLKFHEDAEECEWDIKIVDEEGDEHIVEGIDMCEDHSITFEEEGDEIVYSKN
jgi:hypothetical protein